MLPRTLLCLTLAALAAAQVRQNLELNSVSSFDTDSLPQPASFVILGQLNITITIALWGNPQNEPLFFLSNSTDATKIGGSNGFQIKLTEGYGAWTGTLPGEGTLYVQAGAGAVIFEIGVSGNGPIHENLSEPPLLGDTTSNQALLFSPPFLRTTYTKPTYPNYSLPAEDPENPVPPSSSPNFTLVLAPTSSRFTFLTSCYLSAQRPSGTVANKTLWLRHDDGWRTQWLLSGLVPLTNYTAYVIRDKTKLSGPISFATKSASFSCPLVYSLPYCPGISYTVPLPTPPQGVLGYDSGNLPSAITQPLLSYLANFTTVLTTFPCGRDWYSPIVGCDDCERAYRKWLCAVTFTRCGEASPANPDSFTASPAPPGATGLSAKRSAQVVLSALVPKASSGAMRNPAFQLSTPYSVLLPCLETCTAVDRACPNFLGFQCPTAQFNAAASYGVGYIDGADGEERNGVTGTSQDVWGNVWCNAG